MNIQTIRRGLATAALLATMTAGMAAAEPLPAPAEPHVEIALPAVDLLTPADGANILPFTALRWTNEGEPDTYTMKFKIVGTTTKHKVSLIAAKCEETCSLMAETADLFDYVSHGQTVTWQMIAKYEGGAKVKSAKHTLLAQEVSAPVNLSPATGEVLEQAGSMIWEHSPVNASYLLVIKFVDGDEPKQKIFVPAVACAATCIVNPFEGPEFPTSTTLKWHVKVTGHDGHTAKSAKQTITTSNSAVF